MFLSITILPWVYHFYKDICMDLDEIRVINDLLKPNTTKKIESFHSFFIFYKHFSKNLSTIMAPIKNSLKGVYGLSMLPHAFKRLRTVNTPVLGHTRLSNHSRFDAFGVRIKGTMS